MALCALPTTTLEEAIRANAPHLIRRMLLGEKQN